MSTKKPVVVESYDEIVFSEPSEGFFARVQNHPAVVVPRLPAGFSLPPPSKFLSCVFCIFGSLIFFIGIILIFVVPLEDVNEKKRFDTKDNPLNQWFKNFSEADELLQLAAARQQVSMDGLFYICINKFFD